MILGTLLTSFFQSFVFTDENCAWISELLTNLIHLFSTPIEFSWGAAFVTYFQGIALVIAVIVIIINGWNNGYLSNGVGPDGASASMYIIRSLVPIALIAAMPTILSFISSLVRNLINDLLPTATGAADFSTILSTYTAAFVANPGFVGLLIILVLIVIIVETIKILYDVLVRQIQLAVLGVIGPLVSALTVSNSTSGDMLTLIKEMVGIGLITVLEITLLMSAISLPSLGYELTTNLPYMLFLVPAVFGAARNVPRWIERYTLSPSALGSGGVRGAVMLGTNLVRSASSMRNVIGK